MGRHRLYFNSAADAPYVWSIDDGSQATERLVREVIAHGCEMQTQRLSAAERAMVDAEQAPIVWLEIHGELTIEDGIAKFTPL